MDIMRPRAWRVCGWAATALSGGIAALTVKIMLDGQGWSTPYMPVLNIMIAACALLTAIRLLVPPIAKMRQELELNLGLQRRILGTMEPPATPPVLTLVPPLQDNDLADTVVLPRLHASGQ